VNDRPPLFRPQVLQASDQGLTLGTRPVSWKAIGLLLAGLAVLVAGFALFTDLSRKESLEGYLQPVGGAVRVVAPRSGTLERVMVSLGQRVEAGQALFLVSAERELPGGGSLSAAQLAALDQQLASLRDQLDAARQAAAYQEEQALARLSGLREEEQDLSDQAAMQRERVVATQERLQAIAPLRAKGFISEDEYRNREEYLVSLRQGLSDLSRQLAGNRGEQGKAQIQVQEAAAGLAARSADLRTRIAAIGGQRSEAGAAAAQLVRAPLAGTIVTLLVEPGRHVSAGTPILSVAPGDTRLGAVLLAAPQSVGLIREGQDVRILLDAFPAARFGVLNGDVIEISTTAMPQQEIEGPPRYRVDVALTQQTVSVDGVDVPLQADMTVKADLIVEKRSLLQWLLRPLITAAGRD
jgi:membrane fusion protein